MRKLRDWVRQTVQCALPRHRLAFAEQDSRFLTVQSLWRATPLTIEQPNDFSGAPINLIDFTSDDLPASDIYQLSNGRITPPQGWVFTGDGRLLSEASWFKGHASEMRRQLRLSPRRTQKLRGRTLSLASDYATANYGHFLLDSVGRLALIKQSNNIMLNQFDHFVVNGPESAWKTSLLARCGIPREKLVWLTNSTLQCEQLTATAFPARRRIYTPETVQFLRSTFAATRTKARKRLFIVRKGGNRTLLNQSELLTVAQQFGFEAYRPEDAADSIKDFANADAVIGVHGAGLADIAFMQPGSRVLELMPDDHRFSYFYTLGKSADLNYQIILGQAANTNAAHKTGPSNCPLTVDTATFTDYLQQTFV